MNLEILVVSVPKELVDQTNLPAAALLAFDCLLLLITVSQSVLMCPSGCEFGKCV